MNCGFSTINIFFNLLLKIKACSRGIVQALVYFLYYITKF